MPRRSATATIKYDDAEAGFRTPSVEDKADIAEVSFSLAEREAQVIAESTGTAKRLTFATSFSAAVLAQLWQEKAHASGCNWSCRAGPVRPTTDFSGLVNRIVNALSLVSDPRAGFLAGRLYTVLLPDNVRKALGAYYTPPPLVDRLISLATAADVDWRTDVIVDPACGGAAFLSAVARKMISVSSARTPEGVLADIERRLVGIEIDAFAGWMSMVLLDIAAIKLAAAGGRPLKNLVKTGDALEVAEEDRGRFDVVIGNPPYGKVALTDEQRRRFQRSLFGHANLYGVFTDVAVQLAAPRGIIAYVTPTSFLGGQYFKNLRHLLSKEAPLTRLDFVRDRNGVFDGVLQETTLAVYRRGTTQTPVDLNVIRTENATGATTVEVIAQAEITDPSGGPWILPRSAAQRRLTDWINRQVPFTLGDYGFGVSTGQFVWNRHKKQLRSRLTADCYPIVWAEAINSDGTFHFQAARRAHLPYVRVQQDQSFLINREPCVLVQRTTAKEQRRRLIAAVIPNAFVLEYPGFVVENHLNMVYVRSTKPKVALRTIATLLNSKLLDEIFRCVSGSVAVSAYELNSLPLPDPEQMLELQKALLQDASPEEVDMLLAKYYCQDERPLEPAVDDRRERRRTLAA